MDQHYEQPVVCYVYKGEESISSDTRIQDISHLVVDRHVTILPYRIFIDCISLVDVQLPPGLQLIDEQAFLRCSSLKSISCPASLSMIGAYAFSYCLHLENVNLAEGLQVIEDCAFLRCTSLKQILIPSTVSELGAEAFEGCHQLSCVRLQEGLEDISDNCFLGCSSLAQVWIPGTVHSLGSDAFSNCPSLVSVELSEGLEHMGRAFRGCPSLINVSIPSTAVEIGLNSFEGCTLLLERYPAEEIVDRLSHRYDEKPLHRLCYQQASYPSQSLTHVGEISELIQQHHDDDEISYVDEFGMTPFHILAMSAKPQNMFLWQSLIRQCPNGLLRKKDQWGKCPVYYLLYNTTSAAVASSTIPLVLQVTLIERIQTIVHKQWRMEFLLMVEDFLASIQTNNDKEDIEDGNLLVAETRWKMLNEIYTKLAKYERNESLVVLELAMWKFQLLLQTNEKLSVPSTGGTSSGADIIIDNVLPFWGSAEDAFTWQQ
eukprot:scaffold1136_cov146-Cylindrotheca_fusiformis.AAC.11